MIFLQLVAIHTFLGVAVYATPSKQSVRFSSPIIAEPGGAHNVHITYTAPLDGNLTIAYGSCGFQELGKSHHILGSTHIGSHPLAKRHENSYEDRRPTRFVWLVKDEAVTGGCISAYLTSEGNAEQVLVGSSKPIDVKKRLEKRGRTRPHKTAAKSTASGKANFKTRAYGAEFADITDSLGPWFDGVEYLSQKEPDDVFVAHVKEKRIGIVGGGMSGLMTAFLLDSIGMHNWEILEASTRIGGRIHTSYLNGTRPDQYQYQEMGPMRFPVSVKDPNSNETLPIKDHQLVFQLADAVNERNGNKSDLMINFIKWIQMSPNAPVDTDKRRPDGTIPGMAEVLANSSLATTAEVGVVNETAIDVATAAFNKWAGLDKGSTSEYFKSYTENIFKAHKMAVENGLFDWSESQYIRHVLNNDLNITDQIDSTGDDAPVWGNTYEGVYFSASDWRTIDKGLSSLWRGMEPFTLNRTKLNTRVSALSYDNTTSKMTVKYRNTTADPFTTAPDAESSIYDYVFVAVPFSIVRAWRMNPPFSSLISRAIDSFDYDPSCKIALHYKTRFWEHLPYPILGGCGATDIPLLGSVCYPSYTLNATGPGVLLASYAEGTDARTFTSMSESDHVSYVQRAMVEIHGPIAAKEFTGVYDRVCWDQSSFQAGAWASPSVGQQELYLPAYFQTEMGTVFIGEHTSYTHAWIWSALESGVRGTVQLLVEMGLVDEAKDILDTWMARWISV
ncbi:hypothetical protein BT63DRAFT_441387 [Microthyrium microscopicum]|uniref:Amine oxidase domain-containing protein n=1 Tax=Microthyrium microscopicum TaxID=703497 RepID=A0A6A6U6E3_9PEZI|nr:hypothetical protein BT63DRAFT_441387 [Microthyrium microscopicum]